MVARATGLTSRHPHGRISSVQRARSTRPRGERRTTAGSPNAKSPGTIAAPGMTAMIEGLEAVTVHVRDIHQARKFYGEVLGLSELQFDGNVGRAVFAIPGIPSTLRMHLYDPEEGGREPGTVSGVVFSHHDPVAACKEIERRGGQVTVAPHEIHPPGFTAVLSVIADPDGNEFVLRSPPMPTKS